uniref:CREG-like beta-barrel domain-containing protein n=1 Tax=Kalanchoe fedtschenkoi TaxID=63787 RepID=A0A7N0ZZB9_KALFE
MEVRPSLLSRWVCLSLFAVLGHPGFVTGRGLELESATAASSSPTKPDPKNAAATARWLVEENSWGVLTTLSSDLKGAPFGNVVSFSDGPPENGRGIPYFYLTALDPTARYALKDPRSSVTISEYPLGTCGETDPENPTCAKITLTGKLVLVDRPSEEAKFAENALFTKHSEMEGWPKNHNFQIFKLEIKDIFLIDWFGGPKPLTISDYLGYKKNSVGFSSSW